MSSREAGPYVDYRAAAGRYAANRALAGGVLDGWRRAVSAGDGAVPVAGAVVLDVGAGTGTFSRAWAEWGAAAVVAVEPVAAMRAEAVAAGPPRAHHLAAVAEALPLAAASVDVAWLSAVVHHLVDRRRAFAELARVVRPGGGIHVRGLCPDRSHVVTLAHAPPEAAARALGRFPTAAALTAELAAAGFTPAGATEVAEATQATGPEAAAWVAAVRDIDTMVTAFTDDEVAATIAALRAHPGLLPPSTLTLLTYRRT